MEDIGRYRINTVQSITRKDTPLYQRILSSILKGSCEAIENNDADKSKVYSRLLWLLPPLLLRKPKGSVTKRLEVFIERLEVFIAGDLDFCIKGMLATRDNYFTFQKSHASVTKAAADKVFSGQFSKAMAILTQDQVNATNQEVKEAQ